MASYDVASNIWQALGGGAAGGRGGGDDLEDDFADDLGDAAGRVGTAVGGGDTEEDEAGGLLRTNIRPTLNLLLLLRASV